MSASSSSSSSNYPSRLVEEINEQSLPNNQLGMDDEMDDSIGESTEMEIVNMLERRRRSKVRAEKRGRVARIVDDDDESSPEEGSEEDLEPGEEPTQGIKKKMWHIIIHNKTRDEVLRMINGALPRFTRCIACEDEGEETHNTHYHIGIVMKSSTTMGGVKALFCEDAHVKYCKNLANLFNYIRGTGNHGDFKEVIFRHNDYVTKRIGTGIRQRFLEEWWTNPTMEHFYEMVKTREWMTCCDQRKHLESIVDNLNKWKHIRERDRVILWISGTTGTGKSYLAHHMMEEWQKRTGTLAKSATISSTAGQLVGLKREEKMVLFDDIKVEKIVVQDLLQVVDQYILTVDVKGSEAHYDPDLVVVTCLNRAEDIGNLRSNWEQKEVNQLIRRITHTIDVSRENNTIKYKVTDKRRGETITENMNEAIEIILQAAHAVVPNQDQ